MISSKIFAQNAEFVHELLVLAQQSNFFGEEVHTSFSEFFSQIF